MTFFNMTCLGVIRQVKGRDGMSTPQNGAAALTYHVFARVVSRCLSNQASIVVSQIRGLSLK